ncbi:S41 family peptidase [Emticicia sp. SJ17W-69]|uniref:S41 family peptidase n=1 Tax=Emticicia sp. SJ17W-69 TaxID=3421657 RepID=UPI003EB98D60
MKRGLRYISTILLVISYLAAYSQSYSAEQIREDLTSLKNEIEKYHPDPYKYITKEKFERIYDSLSQSVSGRYSLRDAYFIFLPMVQALGCGHTHMSPDRRLLSKNNSSLERPKYFPFSVRYINNQLLVSRNYSADRKITRGTEILAIDGQPVKKILEHLENISYYNGDGINPNARKYYAIREFRKLYYLWKGEQDSFLLTYRKQGQDKAKTSKIEGQNADFMEKMYEVRYPDVDEDTTGIVSYRVIDSSQRVAMVDIRSFMYDMRNFGRGNFEGETRKIFRKLQENKIENLILDLRGNSGGIIDYSIFFLRYFVTQPFDAYKLGFREAGLQRLKQDYKKFDAYLAKEASSRLNTEFTIKDNEGYLESKYYQKQRPHDEFHYGNNVYVLMNGGTFSAAALLVSKLHNMDVGTYVGMTCGGAYDGCSAAQFSSIQLPNTELEISLPLGRILYNIDSKKYDKPILQPDFEVNPNLEDFLKNEDTVLKFTLNLIKNKVKIR